MTVWAKRSYDDIQYQKVLDERRATFDQAKEAFDSGDYLDAYEAMAEFKFFNSEESDIKTFKRTMVEQIIEKGNNSLMEEDYAAAISHYNLVFDLKPELPWFRVKKNLAKAYKLSGNIDESVSILKNFLVDDFEVVTSLACIASKNVHTCLMREGVRTRSRSRCLTFWVELEPLFAFFRWLGLSR